MSLTALFISILAANVAPDAQVAFAARIYFPPGDNRISISQIYVSRLDGSHRRQISQEKNGPWQVRWIGNQHLAWLTDRKTLKIFDLKSNRVVKKVELPTDAELFEYRNRGRLDLWPDPSEVLSSGKVVPARDRTSVSLWGDDWQLRLENGAILASRTEKSDYAETTGKWTFRYRLRDKDRSVEIPEGMGTSLFRGKNEYAFIRSFVGGGSGGSEEFIYSLDPANAHVRLILKNLDEIDFDPNSRYFAGIEPYRPLVPYGPKKFVWANKLYVGNIKTGKRWQILSDLALGTSIQIRPGL